MASNYGIGSGATVTEDVDDPNDTYRKGERLQMRGRGIMKLSLRGRYCTIYELPDKLLWSSYQRTVFAPHP